VQTSEDRKARGVCGHTQALQGHGSFPLNILGFRTNEFRRPLGVLDGAIGRVSDGACRRVRGVRRSFRGLAGRLSRDMAWAVLSALDKAVSSLWVLSAVAEAALARRPVRSPMDAVASIHSRETPGQNLVCRLKVPFGFLRSLRDRLRLLHHRLTETRRLCVQAFGDLRENRAFPFQTAHQRSAPLRDGGGSSTAPCLLGDDRFTVSSLFKVSASERSRAAISPAD
jgi:hypothetical protein